MLGDVTLPKIALEEEQPSQGISLESDVQLVPDDAVLRSRIQKTDYAMGADSPGQEEIQRTFWLGQEQRMRELAASTKALNDRKQWMQASADLVASAAQEGRPLTDAEMAFVIDRPEAQVASDRTAVEQMYADRVVKEVLNEDVDLEANVAATKTFISNQQIAQRILEETKIKYDNASWASWGADFAKSVVPFYTWWKTKDRVKGVGTSSIMTGSNIAEQMRGLYFLPPEEFEARLREAVDGIGQDNLIDALMFATAAVQYSTSDQILDNVFFGLDTADVATLGATALAKTALKGGSRAARVAKKMQDTVVESANPAMNNADRAVLRGDVAGAAEEVAKDRLNNIGLSQAANVSGLANNATPVAVLNEATKVGFGLADPAAYFRSAKNLTNERTRRLIEALEHNAEILKSSLFDVNHVVRLSDEAAARAFAIAEKEFRRTNFRLEDGIVEVRPVRESVDFFGGVDHIEVVIGKKDALPFVSPEQAETYAQKIYRLPEGGYDVISKGDSYFLRMTKTTDETNSAIADLRLQTDGVAPETWQNRWMGFLRNPDRIRGAAATEKAKVATYGGNAVMNMMSEVAKSIGSLSGRQAARLNDVIDSARFEKRMVTDPKTGQQVPVTGKFYNNVTELEAAYARKGYGRPSDKEIQGYFSFRQLMDYDYAVRNISVYRDKARQGINQKSVGWIHTSEGKSQYKQTPFFEGRYVDALPTKGEPFTVAWYDGTGKGKTGFRLSTEKGWHTDVHNLIENHNYKIIQVADPRDEALRDLVQSGGEPVQYLVVRDIKEKPLALQQVPYNEGGHWIYPTQGYYIKQPRMHNTAKGRTIYDGDMTVHYLPDTKSAQQFAKAYEEARRLFNENSPDLDTFASKNLPYSGAEMRKFFEDKTFDPTKPFVLTRHGQTVGDVAKMEDIAGRNFIDANKSEHSLVGQINSAYAQERGERLTSILNTGTEANPVFKLTGAPLMDPMEAMARSSAQLTKSRFFDDYKHAEVENFVTQFADIFRENTAAVRADPMRFVRAAAKATRKDAELFQTGADPDKLAAAKNNANAIMYLLGQNSWDMQVFDNARQKVVDGLLKSRGMDSTLVQPYLWDAKTDASTILRSSVFHMKLGLLNVVQFPLQAQAVLHAAAIDGNPIRAAQANFLYWSMRMRGLSPTNGGAQSLFGKAASRALGIDSKTVEEAYEAFRLSGMSILEGEYARMDDYLNPKQLYGPSGVSKGLDAATVFFKEGNLTHRGVSFTTAFLRWRAENPKARLNAKELQKIVARADVYYVNMTRASNSPALSSDWASVPAQFFTFHKNLMEQLLGTQLTGAEKARVMLMYSTVYGLPIGAGIGIPGAAVLWPVAESFRQYALEQGWDTDGSLMANVAMNGAAAVAIEMLTGEKYDIGTRYGPGGLSWLQEITDGEFFDVVTGASGSAMGETLSRMEPFATALVDVFSGEGTDLTSADFIDAAREISSVNNIAKVYWLVNSGMWMTKSDQNIARFDADTADLIAVAFGLTPQDVSDMYLAIRSNKQADDAKRALSREIIKNFTRGTKAAASGNRELAETFYRKAKTLATGVGYTPAELRDLYSRAQRENQPLIERIDRNFMLRDPDKRMNNYVERRTKDIQ